MYTITHEVVLSTGKTAFMADPYLLKWGDFAGDNNIILNFNMVALAKALLYKIDPKEEMSVAAIAQVVACKAKVPYGYVYRTLLFRQYIARPYRVLPLCSAFGLDPTEFTGSMHYFLRTKKEEVATASTTEDALKNITIVLQSISKRLERLEKQEKPQDFVACSSQCIPQLIK